MFITNKTDTVFTLFLEGESLEPVISSLNKNYLYETI
jgi:hypothetical protein